MIPSSLANALPLVQAQLQSIAPESRDAPVPGMFDLILRGQRRLDELMRDEALLPSVTQRLLLLSVLGLAIHGVVVGVSAQFLSGQGLAGFYTRGTPVLWMPLSFTFAFVGALCICLPSFYFYTQLSGLDASFRLVTAQALRGQATTSVLLLGVLPFYAAWTLAHVLGFFGDSNLALLAGMCLPFAVGLAGIASVYRSFCVLAEHLPVTHQRRGNFLRRMVLCWGAVYTCVAPVALYRLADALAGKL